VYAPKNINDPEFVETLRDLDPDLVTMSGFSQVLGTDVLDVPSKGIINLHAGKLPEYRGGSPMNWALINGETSGTATVHYATERIDAGGVIAEREFEIGDDDTITDVRERTLEIFPSLLLSAVSQIESGTVETRDFEVSDGAYWGSRMPQDGRIDWSHMTAADVYNFVRSLTHPYPGAFTTYGGEKLLVWEAEQLDETVKHAPGRICMRRGDGRVVAAKDRGILLTRVQFVGGEERVAENVLQHGGYLR
jgi:methionyl-tRNA formyltransferase